MLPGFEAVVEERILNAQKKGELDNLPGQGKPLNFEDMNIPEELRTAHRILKNSGFLPPEVELRKKIKHTEELLATLNEEDPITAKIRKKLNFLMAKLNASRGNTSSPASIPGHYRNTLIKRII